jgi:hypothetical protein
VPTSKTPHPQAQAQPTLGARAAASKPQPVFNAAELNLFFIFKFQNNDLQQPR